MKFLPHDYQRYGLTWLINRSIVKSEAGSALFLDPGLGKTSITLTWLRLLKMLGLSRKVLIVAPLRVIYSVWPRECLKWDQFRSLRCSIIHGTATKRMAAISQDADLYLINPEGIPWLMTYFEKRSIPWDVLVVDESSKFKTWGAARTKALRKMIPQFKHRLILTGTPSPNSLMDLFAQVFIMDEGKALGKSMNAFRGRYFYRGGYQGYQWKPVNGAMEAVEERIGDACLRQSAVDHLDMPELLIHDIEVDLPPDVMKDYRKLERDMFIAIGEDNSLTPSNAGAKYNACRQVANGGLYDEEKKAHDIHGAKVEAIADLAEELQGKPLLIAFQYRHDLERLKRHFGDIDHIDGSVSGKQTDQLIDKWNQGKLRLLAVQPQALSHGVNMQAGPGRDIVWMGLTDDLEIYLQLNARIYRQGVTGMVRVHRVLARRTVDEAVRDRIESKDRSQKSLLDSLARYRERYGTET